MRVHKLMYAAVACYVYLLFANILVLHFSCKNEINIQNENNVF
jgi:hypothetical protein